MDNLTPTQQYWIGWSLAFVGLILPGLYLVVKYAIISAALYLRTH